MLYINLKPMNRQDEWIEIPGFPNYKITKDGRIFSLFTNIEKKAYKDTHGYLRVTLYPIGKKYYVHRLVALAYIPNPDQKPTVNHKNGVKHDNHVDNLEWMTFEENSEHAYSTGLSIFRPVPIIRTNPKDGSEKKYDSYYQALKDLFPELSAKKIKKNNEKIKRVIRGERRTYKGYGFRLGD